MKKFWLASVRILSLVMVLGLITGCFVFGVFKYSTTPIEGWVVDEETGKPLKDVIVVVQWMLYNYKFQVVQGSSGVLTAMEAVTDEKGYFYLPKLGPKTMPRGSYVLHKSPKLIFFKSGYYWKELSNSPKIFDPDKYPNIDRCILSAEKISRFNYQVPETHSDWHGKTIKLKIFEDSLEKYAVDLGRINESLVILGLPQTYCGWKKIPRLVQALEQQRMIFESANISNILRPLDQIEKNSPKSCGSPHAFFRSYL